MLSSIIIKSLITKHVITNDQITIQGTKMIFDNPNDFQDEENLLTQMKSANIDTIRLEGSSINNMPTFIGIQMVKTFECETSCSIPQKYFYQNQNIRNVFLGKNVGAIYNYAFAYSSLEFIDYSETTYITDGAFANCTHLDISKVHKLSYACFYHTNLKNITITVGGSVSINYVWYTAINHYAFCECYNLESITINISSFIIGTNAFQDCFKLKEIIIPDNCEITKIYAYAFENCPLESINLKNAKYLGDCAFRNTKLKQVTLNKASLGDHVFAHCDDLIEVNIIDNLDSTSIFEGYSSSRSSKEFFIACQSLESVDLGLQKYTHIGMFKNCFNLKEIKSSNPDLKIGLESFFSCLSLTKITTNISEIGENASCSANLWKLLISQML